MKMYKIMVVDDEEDFREGFRDFIPYGELGFEYAGDADNGMDAVELARQVKPDVVLCDINMPKMDGLEFAERFLEISPRSKVVFITGYDEFQFAQQAVKLNVYEYLLKPLTPHEVESLLHSLKEQLDRENDEQRDIEQMKIKLRESLPLLRERYLNQWVNGRIRKEDLEVRMEAVGVALTGGRWTVMAVEPDHQKAGKFSWDDELLSFSISNILEDCLADMKTLGHIFINQFNQNVAVVSTESLTDKEAESLFIEIAEKMREAVERHLKVSISIGMGEIVNRYTVSEGFQGAMRALDYKFLFGGNKVFYIKDMEYRTSSQNGMVQITQIKDRLVNQLKVATADEAEIWLKEFFSGLEQSKLNPDICKVHVVELVTLISKTYFEYLSSRDVSDSPALHPIYQVSKCTTLKQMKVWIGQWILEILTAIRNRREDDYERRVAEAMEFMAKNYHLQELTIQMVCDHLHLSVSYFSLIFKRMVGETFVEYLTGLRMQKARELLRTSSLKSYEISELVGYGNPHYFSLVFKKVVGVSPSEYRIRS